MKTKLYTLLISILCCITTYAKQADKDKKAYDKTSLYKKEKIEGFTVMINPKAEKHPKELKEAKNELVSQIKKIKKAVPAKVFKDLQKVRIWLEWEAKKNGAAEYHPSDKWLKNNGYNPEKAKSIEICNIKNFVRWSRSAQPWMLMHELAHAYHHTILGYDNEEIKTAYENAKNKKIYDKVKHVDGKSRKAYAMNNFKEYFSELTEAYFGKNDFYPFNPEDLEKHDPDAYKLLRKLWKDK